MELLMIILLNIWTIMFNTYNCNGSRVLPSPKFSAIIVFGDSTMDTGNNNYIQTIVKANFHPYGDDYPGHIATGRFSNGKLIPDFLASFLNLKQAVPPFLNPKLSDNELITGVNFASAGSGFDNATMAGYNVISISKQIENFKNYITRLNTIVGEEKAKNIISGALVLIGAGTNDVSGKAEENNTMYQDFLLNKIQKYIKELYDLGCRSMIMSGLPPIGCLPSRISQKLEFNGKCLEDQNAYALSYNQKLLLLLSQLQTMLSGSKIVYVDVYQQLLDMINNPSKYGFAETKKGCCGIGLYEMSFLCNPLTVICGQRHQYIFFDAIHPCQTSYQYLSRYIQNQVLPKLL